MMRVATRLCGIAVIVAATTPHVLAQTGPAPGATAQPGGGRVAVLDISRVFKSHSRFNAEMEGIKREVESFEKLVNDQRKGIQTLQQSMASYKTGSPEYKRTEEDIARQMSDLQVRSELKRKEIMDRESKLYHATYQEVVAIVGSVAQRYGIQLVIRHDGESINPQDRTSVLKGINREVVFHRNLDLTDVVLEEVNRQSLTRQPAVQQPLQR